MFSFNKFHQLLMQNIGEICCHSLRGSVDWNILKKLHPENVIVTPYAGVWIEILTTSHIIVDLIVTPYAGVWIEIMRVRGA
mgnify:CR=1 FL=1